MSTQVTDNIGQWPKRLGHPSRLGTDGLAAPGFELSERRRGRDAAPLVTTAASPDAQPQDAEPQEPAPARLLSDTQREHLVRQTLTRFVRNKAVPEELETLRFNLIAARVLAGLTAVESAERFGYANSTQLSLIESGGRPPPRDWKFLRQAAQVYGVSVDFLLGLSPHMEFDAKVAQQHALMRRTEDLVGGVASQIATALIEFSKDQQITACDCERIEAAIVRVDETLDRLRTKHDFDNMPGTAPHLAAVDALREVAAPVRRRLRKRQALQGYIEDVRAGRLPLIPALRERYSQAAVRTEVLGGNDDIS